MIRRVAAVCIALLLTSCSELERRELGIDGSQPDGVFSQDLRPRFGNPLNQPRGNGASNGGPVPQAQVYHGASDEFAAGAPGARSTTPTGDSYDLNFENSDVGSVCKVILGDILGATYSIDPRVSGPISLSSARAVPKRDLLPLLESALKLANATLIKEGPLYKVMPSGEVTAGGVVDNGGRVEPGFGLSILPMRFVSAQAVVRSLDSFSARPGAIRADSGRNLLLIQGSATERAQVLDTALALDVDFMKNQSVGIFPVTNVNPEAVVAELQTVFDSGKEGGGQDAVRFQAMPRLNAVLAVARNPGSIDRIRTWIGRLDRSDFGEGSLRVYKVKYGNAKVIAGLLREVFTGQSSGTGDSSSGATSPFAPGSQQRSGSSSSGSGFGSGSSSGSGSGSSGYGSSSGSGSSGGMFNRGDLQGFGQSGGTDPNATGAGSGTGSNPGLASLGEGRGSGSGTIRITADVANNAILVSAPRDQYRLIERAIQQLDAAPVQVSIEATIAEVTLQGQLQYGVQAYLRYGKGSSVGFTGSSSTTTTPNISPVTPGFNSILGPSDNPRLIINALKAVTDVKVLSSPSLVVVNNQIATLEVGDQVPIITRQATDTSNPLAPTLNSVDYRDTGVILKVLPRVGSDGSVNLDVQQEVSNVVSASTSGSGSSASTDASLTPTISQRRIQSSVTVMSGQTVVLGGMIGSRLEKQRSGLPFLGNLASSLQNNLSNTNTEIIVFIRPQIIRDSSDASAVSEELRNKMQVLRRDTGGRPPSVVKY